jgi:hypothetical protein
MFRPRGKPMQRFNNSRFNQNCFGQIHLRESAESADAFRVQPAVLAPGAAGPWLKNFS